MGSRWKVNSSSCGLFSKCIFGKHAYHGKMFPKKNPARLIYKLLNWLPSSFHTSFVQCSSTWAISPTNARLSPFLPTLKLVEDFIVSVAERNYQWRLYSLPSAHFHRRPGDGPCMTQTSKSYKTRLNAVNRLPLLYGCDASLKFLCILLAAKNVCITEIVRRQDGNPT